MEGGGSKALRGKKKKKWKKKFKERIKMEGGG